MKIQDVKKECAAIVGLSIEFSNSEISSISNLLPVIENSIQAGIKNARDFVDENGEQYRKEEKIYASVDLKTLKRVNWLLARMTMREDSGLFNDADKDFEECVNYINNATLPNP